jgi:hypothetical protein
MEKQVFYPSKRAKNLRFLKPITSQVHQVTKQTK